MCSHGIAVEYPLRAPAAQADEADDDKLDLRNMIVSQEKSITSSTTRREALRALLKEGRERKLLADQKGDEP